MLSILIYIITFLLELISSVDHGQNEQVSMLLENEQVSKLLEKKQFSMFFEKVFPEPSDEIKNPPPKEFFEDLSANSEDIFEKNFDYHFNKYYEDLGDLYPDDREQILIDKAIQHAYIEARRFGYEPTPEFKYNYLRPGRYCKDPERKPAMFGL